MEKESTDLTAKLKKINEESEAREDDN